MRSVNGRNGGGPNRSRLHFYFTARLKLNILAAALASQPVNLRETGHISESRVSSAGAGDKIGRRPRMSAAGPLR